jgi:hypothetical protein
MNNQRQLGGNSRLLWIMMALAIAYMALIYNLHTLTGTDLGDGTLGVLLGLYICSHPAANAVNLLFMDRHAMHDITSDWSGMGWFVLNMFVLFCGWIVIVIGATHFVGPVWTSWAI